MTPTMESASAKLNIRRAFESASAGQRGAQGMAQGGGGGGGHLGGSARLGGDELASAMASVLGTASKREVQAAVQNYHVGDQTLDFPAFDAAVFGLLKKKGAVAELSPRQQALLEWVPGIGRGSIFHRHYF